MNLNSMQVRLIDEQKTIPELLVDLVKELEDSALEERIAWGRKYLNMES
ncbi:MAG: hypothetical protein K9K79_10015 [Desulfohalobiaceae bacterium]|nr:hypothetical protein [Desulfohalobiaceae bacterium]